MNVEITIIGTEKALNVWTTATAKTNGKKYLIQMVRFNEGTHQQTLDTEC